MEALDEDGELAAFIDDEIVYTSLVEEHGKKEADKIFHAMLVKSRWHNAEMTVLGRIKKIVGEERWAQMRERREKLNADFEWTPENIRKLTALNKRIVELTGNAFEELKRHKKRLGAKKDYTLEAHIEPLPVARHENIANWKTVNGWITLHGGDTKKDIDRLREEALGINWANGKLGEILAEHFKDTPMVYLTKHLLFGTESLAYQDVVDLEPKEVKLWISSPAATD